MNINMFMLNTNLTEHFSGEHETAYNDFASANGFELGEVKSIGFDEMNREISSSYAMFVIISKTNDVIHSTG